MEINEMTIEDIEKRVSEITEEMEKPEADIEALKAECEQMEARKLELKAQAENRVKELEEEARNAKEISNFKEERKMEIEVRNSKEYIDAYAKYIKTEDDKECRALLSENGNGKVAVPELVDEIVRHAWEKDGIMKRVKKSFIKGNLKVGFEVSATGAAVHTEGADANLEEVLVLGITELVPQSIKKWITISDEAMDLSGEAFLRYVYEEVAYQIAKKAADGIITDIEACGTVSTNSGTTHQAGVPIVSAPAIALGTVAKAIGLLSDEAANPVVMMNKATWSEFKALQYQANYPVDPFEGLDVEFNSTIKSFTAASTGDTYVIVGDLGVGALANFPNGEEITFKLDDKSLAEKDLVKIVGREYIGHDVVAPNAFVKIQK